MTREQKKAIAEVTEYYFALYKHFYAKCNDVELALKLAQSYNASAMAGNKAAENMQMASVQEVAKYMS